MDVLSAFDPVQSPEATTSGLLSSRLRWIAVRGLAGATAGLLVLGFGGRLVMFTSRLLHPDAVGRITENGNRVGDFTVGGTFGLVLFGGLLSGLVAGVVWAFVKEWIPDNPVLVGVGTVAIGGFALVEADNPDFVILVDPRIDLLLLLGLLFIFGLALIWSDRLLGRRIPSKGGTASTLAYALIVAVGVPFLIPTFGMFFSREFCFCESPPIWMGLFLLGAAMTTVTWWTLALRRAMSPPPMLKRLGAISVAGAVVAGGVHLTGQILAIL